MWRCVLLAYPNTQPGGECTHVLPSFDPDSRALLFLTACHITHGCITCWHGADHGQSSHTPGTGTVAARLRCARQHRAAARRTGRSGHHAWARAAYVGRRRRNRATGSTVVCCRWRTAGDVTPAAFPRDGYPRSDSAAARTGWQWAAWFCRASQPTADRSNRGGTAR